MGIAIRSCIALAGVVIGSLPIRGITIPEFHAENFSGGEVFGQDLSRELELKGVRVPLGASGRVVTVELDHVRVVSKKMQGLRIGLIPELEIEGMAWTVEGVGIGWCEEIRIFFERQTLLKGARFRGFKMAFARAADFTLQAKEAKFGETAGRLELRGVAMRSGGRRFFFAVASLELIGPAAGKLVVADQKQPGIVYDTPLKTFPAPTPRPN